MNFYFFYTTLFDGSGSGGVLSLTSEMRSGTMFLTVFVLVYSSKVGELKPG